MADPFLDLTRETVTTFAEPGSTLSFTETVAVGADLLAASNRRIGRAVKAVVTAPVAPILDPHRYRDVFGAAERAQRLTGNAFSENAAIEEAMDRNIALLLATTGTELENPERGGYTREARRRLGDEAMSAPADQAVQMGGSSERGGRPAMRRRIFAERVAALREANPDKAALFDSIAADPSTPAMEPRALAREAVAAQAEQWQRPDLNPIAGLAFGFAGALWGQRRDPIFLGSLVTGPTSALGKSALSRIATSGLFQGLYNMGLTLAEQPVVQDWRQRVGLESGFWPAAEETALAFLFGAIPGAGIRGLQELAAAPRAALTRMRDGATQPGDAETVAKAIGTTVDADTARTLRAGEAAIAAEEVTPPPLGVSREAADAAVAQAVRHGDDPVNEPPPEILTPVPDRPQDQARVIDEAEPVTLGARETVAGKPVTFERFDPRELQADAATFQYKGGSDSAGVTERLRGVTQWDATASGKTFVWERNDAALFVADGHQRLGLAKRLLGDGGAPKIMLDGFRFREADGWSAADVRALAAKKNMQEGSGDALDAARILRDRPDLLDGSLPITGPTMKAAIALSRLSDEAFGMAINGVVPINHAAAVGAMVPDRLQHAAVMADLARFAPDTDREARLLIGEILAAGFKSEEQINLFGASTMVNSLMGERVRVLDTALQALVRDKKLFGTLALKADAIEAAGNVLQRGVNEQRATDAAQLADMVTRLAQRTGAVSDALNRAAAQVANGMKPGKAAQAFLDDLRMLIDRDGLAGLMAAPELKPGNAIEPGTPEALDAAQMSLLERTEPVRQSTDERLIADLERGEITPLGVKDPEQVKAFNEELRKAEEAGAPQRELQNFVEDQQRAQSEPPASLFDAVAVTDADGNTRFISRAQALEEAERTSFHADVVKSCKD